MRIMADVLERSRFLARRVTGTQLATALALVAAALVIVGTAVSLAQSRVADGPDIPYTIVDSDDDCLPDVMEQYVYGTDPLAWNSTPLAVPDGWLVKHGYDPRDPTIIEARQAVPAPEESPGAFDEGLAPLALPLADVYRYGAGMEANASKGCLDNGIDPSKADQTGGGVATAWLLRHGLDPLDASVLEKQAAGGASPLTLRQAYENATDPFRADTDGDGLPDILEIEVHHTHPARFSTTGSGVPDGWLVAFGLDPTDRELAERDVAHKGMTVQDVYEWSNQTLGLQAALARGGLDPTRMSTVGGPVPDGWLVAHGLDPLDGEVLAREVARVDADPPGALLANATLPSCLTLVLDENKTSEALPACVLTVADAYSYRKPGHWREEEEGPWWGGLDPSTHDTDGDGLGDALEIRGWLANVTYGKGNAEPSFVHVRSDPLVQDSDGDGLTDAEEYQGKARVGDCLARSPRTDPSRPDTDFDGLDDVTEVAWGVRQFGCETAFLLDPTRADTPKSHVSDGARFEYWSERAARYRENASYEFPGSNHTDLSWVRSLPAADGSYASLSAGEIADLFLPEADLGSLGVPNLLHSSTRGHDLADGWAILPETMVASPFGAPHPRPPTDPANPDTDGDGLPDWWEFKYGRWNAATGGWDLDPSQYSSAQDGISDAERDPDGDSIEWITIAPLPGPPTPQRNAHRFTNLDEYEFGTDPGSWDTSGDGLPDGWKVFWGKIYPTLPASEAGRAYPGAPGPLQLAPDAVAIDPTARNEHELYALQYVRFSESSDVGASIHGLQITEDAASPHRVRVPEGGTQAWYKVPGTIHWTLLDAQVHDTNPYLADTDGDGMPDPWEVLRGLDPLDPLDAAQDADVDGLANLEEFWLGRAPFDLNAAPASLLPILPPGTDPHSADTDRGGLSDLMEFALGLDALDPSDDGPGGEAVDSDRDGVSDFLESFGRLVRGVRVVTNASDPDTDRDGLVDGGNVALTIHDTRVANWTKRGILLQRAANGAWQARGSESVEASPAKWDSLLAGVPDGWIAAHTGVGRSEAIAAAYAQDRPSWWSEPEHGVWWWGRAPFTPVTADRDCDGLDDLNGEDPFPGFLSQPAIERDGGLLRDVASVGDWVGSPSDPEARLLRAQSIAPHPWTSDPTASCPEIAPRASTRIVIERFDGVRFDPTVEPRIPKGEMHSVEGRLVPASSETSSAGVPNVPVFVGINGRANLLGVGITDGEGRFNISFAIEAEHRFRIDPPGVAILSRASGEVVWRADPAVVRPGRSSQGIDNALHLWSSNTTPVPPPGHPQRQDPSRIGAYGVAAAPSVLVNVSVQAAPVFEYEVPSDVSTSGAFNITARLVDGAGVVVPLDFRLNFSEADGQQRSLVARGEGLFTIDAPDLARSTTFCLASDGSSDVAAARTCFDQRLKERVVIEYVQLDTKAALPGAGVVVFGRLASDALPPAGLSIQSPLSAEGAVSAYDGSFALVVHLPSPLASGPFEIPFTVMGGAWHLPTGSSLAVEVLEPTNLTMSLPPIAQLGSQLTLDGRLVTAGGQAIRKVPVLVQIGSRQVATTTELDGTFHAQFVPSEVGALQVTASFAGSANRAPVRLTALLVVWTNTTLTLEVPPAVKGQAALITGRLLDEGGSPVPGALVTGAWGGVTAWTAVTSETGEWRASVRAGSDDPRSALSVRGSFAGSLDGSLRAVVAEMTTPLLTPIEARFDDETVRPGENLLRGKLVPIARTSEMPRRGTLVTPWGDVATIEARQDGAFEVGLRVPRDVLTPTVSVELAFDDHEKFVAAAPGVELALVVGTSVELDSPGVLVKGKRSLISGFATTLLGDPIPSGTARLMLRDAVLMEARIKAGRFQFEATPSASERTGAAELAVEFVASPPYASSRDSALVLVRSATTIEVADSLASRLTQPEFIEATLKQDGAPVTNRTILVTDGPGGEPYAVTTGPDGVARVPIGAAFAAGARDVDLLFLGDADFAPAAATMRVSTLAPPAAASFGLLAAIALALLAVVLGLVARARRRRKVRDTIRVIELAEASLVAGDEFRATAFLLYRNLQAMAGARGHADRPESTPREFARIIHKALPISASSLDQLVRIFELARYSTARIPPKDLEVAAEGLRQIRIELSTVVHRDAP